MRVQPGTGRIYQLSPTSRMGSTPLQPRQTAPLAAPVAKPAPAARQAGFLDGLKGLFGKVMNTVSNAVSGFFSLFSFGSKGHLEAGGRPLSSGGGGTGVV